MTENIRVNQREFDLSLKYRGLRINRVRNSGTPPGFDCIYHKLFINAPKVILRAKWSTVIGNSGFYKMDHNQYYFAKSVA